MRKQRQAVGVVPRGGSVPENVNKRAVEKFKELLERAEGEIYRIYSVAVGVK